MRTVILTGIIGGLLVGYSADFNVIGQQLTASRDGRVHGAVAGFSTSDVGSGNALVTYRSAPAFKRGAYTWHAIGLNEEHALQAIASHELVVNAPDGQPIRLSYEKHTEHSDGNWTWVGRTAGAGGGREAILTFGEKAVFGSIPYQGGELDITTVAGRTWLLEPDQSMLRRMGDTGAKETIDYLPQPRVSAPAGTLRMRASGDESTDATPAPAALTPDAATAPTTVDLVLGYTSGFAVRLGGQSQANTRLHFLVDVANQAYSNSQLNARLRLVSTVSVNYPDATSNRTALFELTGVTCTTAIGGQLPYGGVNCTHVGQPAALQPLIVAREKYGADLVALIRKFEDPENQSCGLGWLLGGGQTAINDASADFAMSVVSDSSGAQFPDNGSTCRHEGLAHELGHNMGQQHDAATAQGSDDTNSDGNLLDPEEYGRHAYSFAYVAAPDAGNFYTVMANRQPGLVGYRVFANPRVTCGGFPCGTTDQSDNVRSMLLTMPVIASFRASVIPVGPVWLRGDFNGDGKSDLVWRHFSTGGNVIWRSANAATPQSMSTVPDQAWRIAGAADFDGDGRSDILWRNSATGGNTIWKSANAATQLAVTSVQDQAWTIAGAGDFNADGKSDILWRNRTTGGNSIWKSANSSTTQWVTTLANQAWQVAGTGDFDGDGRDDILWRNSTTGANTIWKSGSSATQQAVTSVTNLDWHVVAAGDFDADGRADILWRNFTTGANTIWKAGNAATQQAMAGVDTSWWIVAVGDFDGDGRADVLWRNFTAGSNVIWKSANVATPQWTSSVSTPGWTIVG